MFSEDLNPADDPLEPKPAADRIRAFEETHLADASRVGGVLERGHGSLFKQLPTTHQRHHADLERLAEAETSLTAAQSALVAAQTAYDAAKAQADQSEPDAPAPSIERSESEKGSG